MNTAAKTPLLLIHGFAQTAKSWQTVIAAMSMADSDRALHAIELPGHGATALTLGEPTVESVRAFTAERMARLGLATAVVWGYSQGSRVALDFALSHPDRVAALVLESGTAGIDDRLKRADRRSRDYALSKRIEQSDIEQFVELWESVPALAGQSPVLVEAQRADRLSHDPAALAVALRGIGQSAYEPMWDRLAQISVPVLTLSGDRDGVYSRHAERIAASVPNGRQVAIRDAGHSAHLERPEAAVAEVVAFLRDENL